MTIQHDSMVHEGVCSTKCQHTQPKNNLPAQPKNGPHTQQDAYGPHAQTGADLHVRTTHVSIIITYTYYVVIIIVLLHVPNGMHAYAVIFSYESEILVIIM